MHIRIAALLISLLLSGATTAQDALPASNVAQADPHFIMFEWNDGQPYSAFRDWLKQNRAVFNRADLCRVGTSHRDVGPHSSGMGSGLFALSTFLVVRDVDTYEIASRTFHDEHSGLDIKVHFEFPSAERPGLGNKKGSPPQMSMSLSVHRGKDDSQGDIGRSEVAFFRDTRGTGRPVLTKLALIGDIEYRYELACSDPRERLRIEEHMRKVQSKHRPASN